MKVAMGNGAPGRRLTASIEELYRRKSKKSKVKNNDEKQAHTQDRSSCCKYPLMKFVLLLIVCGTLVLLLHSPPDAAYRKENVVSNSNPNPATSRKTFIDRWIWGASDPRYVSNIEETNWDDVNKVIEKLRSGSGSSFSFRGIGLLNFKTEEVGQWKELVPDTTQIVLPLDYAEENVTWDSLFPEWIDEEQESQIPACPSLPRMDAPRKRLDLVAVKLPCRKKNQKDNWSKDVGRLHLQLSAAAVAASSIGKGPYVLFVTECFPIPNLFTCKELVTRQGNVWLYKPNLNLLREKLRLPVGSCELALANFGGGGFDSGNRNPAREAYATILHSAHVYVCGAIAAAQSIRMSGSTRDLVILVDKTITSYHRSGLEAAGWKVRTIERIRNPKAEKDAYNEWNYSKFRLWQLTDYDKLIFIDADLLILRNIDFLFGMPEISATGNNGTMFNSGVMIIEPSNCTFQVLMDHINEFESYNGGDQGYLNQVFTWWHRIPKQMNFLKHFWMGDSEQTKQKKIHLFSADPPVLYVLHYLGIKPWLCYRDYDCNWNNQIMREFASDDAHHKWWKVHDQMPQPLHQFCLLRSKQKATLEWDRLQAEKANFSDAHWKIQVKDSRRKKCIDKLCNWKSMLKHWGETNWTDDKPFYPSPPAIHLNLTSPN